MNSSGAVTTLFIGHSFVMNLSCAILFSNIIFTDHDLAVTNQIHQFIFGVHFY